LPGAFYFPRQDGRLDGRWRELSGPNTVTAIRAMSNEQAYAIASDGTLLKYDRNGRGTVQPTGTYFTEISAARDNDVYMVIANNSGWERTGGGQWVPFAASGTVF
jgi:hypothetical protein